jgi:hypothetical protein
MNSPTDIRAILDATANQILAVVAPDTARLVRAYVSLDERADTAATDGVRIWLPPTFEGVDVAQDTPVAVGLLVHELGHFLQPLKALEEVEQQTGAPHWLGNVVADIQLEAMMASLFPPLADTLTAVRTVVKQARSAEYTTSMLQGRSLTDIACSVALAGRFLKPDVAFDDNRHPTPDGVWRVLDRLGVRTVADRARWFAYRLSEALCLAPNETAAHIAQIMAEFPELRQAAETFPLPGGVVRVVGPSGRAAQAEAASNTGDHDPLPIQPVASVRTVRGRPRPEAQQAARGLRVHFHTVRGATEIAAPGRLDRRAAVLGELIPLRMGLPGKERPRPKVLICLDKSGSMKGAKFVLAQTAAQAVVLAVREAGGEVVGILFDDSAQIAASGDDALLFCEPDGLSYGGTAFEFLADAWRRWSTHVVLLVTDGDGSIPQALPGDKARTSAILIPPDCDPGAMGQIAERVVTLTDLRGLAEVMTLLTPRASC